MKFQEEIKISGVDIILSILWYVLCIAALSVGLIFNRDYYCTSSLELIGIICLINGVGIIPTVIFVIRKFTDKNY